MDDNTTGSPKTPARNRRFSRSKPEEPVVYSPLVLNTSPLNYWDNESKDVSQKKEASFLGDLGSRVKVTVQSILPSPKKKSQPTPTEMMQLPLSSSSPAKTEPDTASFSSYAQVRQGLGSLNFDPDAEPDFDASLDNDDPFLADLNGEKADKTSASIGAKMKELGNKIKNIDKDPIAAGIALLFIGGVLVGAGSAIGGPANPLGASMIAIGTAVGIMGVVLLTVGFVLKLMDLYDKYSNGKNNVEVELRDCSNTFSDTVVPTDSLLADTPNSIVCGH